MSSANLQSHLDGLTDYIAVSPSEHVLEGQFAEVSANGWRLLLLRLDGQIGVFNNRCPHASAPLHLGKLRHGEIMCPLHGARFDAVTGVHVAGRYSALSRIEFRELAGQVEVRVPIRAPGPGDCPIQMPS